MYSNSLLPSATTCSRPCVEEVQADPSRGQALGELLPWQVPAVLGPRPPGHALQALPEARLRAFEVTEQQQAGVELSRQQPDRLHHRLDVAVRVDAPRVDGHVRPARVGRGRGELVAKHVVEQRDGPIRRVLRLDVGRRGDEALEEAPADGLEGPPERRGDERHHRAARGPVLRKRLTRPVLMGVVDDPRPAPAEQQSRGNEDRIRHVVHVRVDLAGRAQDRRVVAQHVPEQGRRTRPRRREARGRRRRRGPRAACRGPARGPRDRRQRRCAPPSERSARRGAGG